LNRRMWIGWLIGLWGLSGCTATHSSLFERDVLTPAEHLALGNVYLFKNETVLAIRQYQAALAEDKHFVPAFMALGNVAFENHDCGKARSYFEKALDQDPANANVMNNLAMVYLAEGKHLDRAEALVDQALVSSNPLKPYLLETRAAIDLKEGHYLDAQQAFQQAAAMAPRDKPDMTQHLQESCLKPTTTAKTY
jgi:type IV pilus assembly protein PilF